LLAGPSLRHGGDVTGQAESRRLQTSDPTPRLELRHVTKNYPGCLANDRIDLAVNAGEIHALLGENGAGKSTLVKIIYGVIKADHGEILWQGQPVTIADPKAARALGIGMVFQHFSLFEALTVEENIALGIADSGDRAALERRIVGVSHEYGLPLDPARVVRELSVGERQRIEIVRCLLQSPKLLIMDEPTSVLTPQESLRLFETLRKLAAEGCSILYISHRLEEIRVLCHRATVLRMGRVVGACDPTRETPTSLAQMMIGTELRPPKHGARTPGAVRFQVDGLSLKSPEPFGVELKQVRLEIRAGEIFGIAGVAGNGQQELFGALSGEALAPRNSIRVDGRQVGHVGPDRRRQLGVAFVPEERLGHGAVPDMPLTDNAFLSGYGPMRLLAGGFIKIAAVARFTRAIVERFDVRTPAITAAAQSLSGGNLQKFIMGREIEQKPGVLIAAHPTWGVDAGAEAAIHQALFDLADAGTAVLVISQDLDELFEISDRIAVLNNGVLSAPRITREVSVDEIGLLMGGLHDLPQTPPTAPVAHA
jgi:ABC-type uncharacterized transport system ATPase subunit